MLGLIVSQLSTGVFPIPISPVQSAHAAGFFIKKELTKPTSRPVEPGDDVHYKITVENIITGTANSIVVTDSIPSGLIYNSSTPNICSSNGSTVTCNIENINEGVTEDVTIKFTVDPNIQSSDNRCYNNIYNQARADADDDDNTPTDLTIDKTANTTEALAGTHVSYTITIRNTGGSDLTNAVLTDDYPEQYVNITDTGRGSDTGGRLTWNLGTLRANSTTVVRYNARLKTGVTRGTSVRNTATVRSRNITRTDDHVIVIPSPPVTGLGGFIKGFTQSNDFLSDDTAYTGSDTSTLVAVRPQAQSITASTSGVIDTEAATAATNLPMMIWITTMLTGLGMGGMFGRKFLF
jgi:uncharacterized repeat protein (TIGR01451 family)